MTRAIILFTFFLLSFALPTMTRAQFDTLQQGTNRKYEEGDWISYSVARYVSSIAIGREYVYFGTAHSGILRYHQYRQEWDFPFTSSNGLTDNTVWVVAFDEDNDFTWCATQFAISFYNPTARVWDNSSNEEIGLSKTDKVESIGIDRDKIYFLTAKGQVFECSKWGGIFFPSNERVFDKVEWFGKKVGLPRDYPHYFMDGDYVFNLDGSVEDNHFRKAEIVAAVDDKWDNRWIATWGHGPGKADQNSLRLELFEVGLANQTVDAIAIYEDVMWLGGAGSDEGEGGVTSWDMRDGHWTRYEQRWLTDLRSDKVFNIFGDDDFVWFATDYGLASYKRQRKQWHETFDSYDGLSDNLVYDVVSDDSCIWVATDLGINQIYRHTLGRNDTLQIERVNPHNTALVRVLDLELMGNLLWAATEEGVYVYDTNKREGGYLDEIDGPFAMSITSISYHGNEICFGSARGVDIFNTDTREWAGLPKGRAFPNTHINKVVSTAAAIWAATDKGVMKYDRQYNDWRTFTKEDGLLDDRVNAILPDGDYIWFGSKSGLTRFFWNDPSRID